LVATRSANPLELNLIPDELRTARDIIDLNFDNNKWDLVSNKVAATQRRVENGRKRFGKDAIFLDASYGSEKGGRSLDKPIGAITTVNHHYVVHGEHIRPITLAEKSAAQTFPSDYLWPSKVTEAKRMIGNAVPPLLAKKVTEAILRAA
jgi:DNA (cytosine-5)-methyltransferase 1